MSNGPWTDEENDLIVADYFAMLADDISGRPYKKAEHRRTLRPLLNDRSEGSVEFKHQNISAVLKGLGEDWIPGYKPAFNFQMTLVDAVARWLDLHPDWLGRLPDMRPADGMREAAQVHRLRDLQVIALAASINRRYGGSLRTIFRSLIQAIRSRESAQRELRALTAETRFSAMVLGLIPVGLTLYILLQNPQYYADMWADASGRATLIFSVVLQVSGIFVIWRMMRSTEEADA